MNGRTPPSDDENKQSDTIVYQAEFDPTTDSVCEIVIRTIAVLNNAKPTDLPPLSGVIDPEALDALFRPRASEHQCCTDTSLRFGYDVYSVDVYSDGQIVVCLGNSDIGD